MPVGEWKAGHVGSAVRERRQRNADAHQDLLLISPFLSLLDTRNIFRVSLLPQLNFSRKSHTDIHKGLTPRLS